MKKSQLNAIYYQQRERRLAKLEKLGLLDDFRQWNKGKKYLCISAYCNFKIVQSLFEIGDNSIINELRKV